MGRLTELDPLFISRNMNAIEGLEFDCPKCRTHRIRIWFKGVPPEIEPGPGRWKPRGDDFENLTLLGPPDSIEVLGGCRLHGQVVFGKVMIV